jgi:cold shock CspA family protein
MESSPSGARGSQAPSRVIAGVVTQLTNARDAKWGKVRLAGFMREIFFTAEDLINSEEFDRLTPGQPVEFEEQPDRAQGMRAVNLRPIQESGS